MKRTVTAKLHVLFAFFAIFALSLPLDAFVAFPFDTQTASQTAKIAEYGTEIYLASSAAVDGDTTVVGAPFAYAPPLNLRQGAAYVYVKTPNGWGGQARLAIPRNSGTDIFGSSVAISGDTIVVGSPSDDICGDNFGAAYVFVRTTGGVWTLEAQLCSNVGALGNEFGHAVAVSGNTVVVGEHGWDGADYYRGTASVFVRNGTTWTLQKQLFPSISMQGSHFGKSVSIDGGTIVVGASDYTIGSAYVFVRDGSNWTEQQRLEPSDGVNGDSFGSSVAINRATIAIGSVGDDIDGHINQGSAYVFARTGSSWAQQAKLVAADGAEQDNFGDDLGLDGECLVVGSPFARVGATSKQGAGYLYMRSGTTWVPKEKIVAADGTPNDRFGASAGVSGKNIILGAPTEAPQYSGQGALYIFANPFVVNVPVSGRVTDSGGRGVAGALVSMTDEHGDVQTHMTNHFGYYRFFDVLSNNTYTLSVRSKRFVFTPRSVTVVGDLTGVDFTPAP